MEERNAVAQEQRVEIEVEEPAHALPEPSGIVHHRFAQQAEVSRRIADDGVPDDEDAAYGPVERYLSR